MRRTLALVALAMLASGCLDPSTPPSMSEGETLPLLHPEQVYPYRLEAESSGDTALVVLFRQTSDSELVIRSNISWTYEATPAWAAFQARPFRIEGPSLLTRTLSAASDTICTGVAPATPIQECPPSGHQDTWRPASRTGAGTNWQAVIVAVPGADHADIHTEVWSDQHLPEPERWTGKAQVVWLQGGAVEGTFEQTQEVNLADWSMVIVSAIGGAVISSIKVTADDSTEHFQQLGDDEFRNVKTNATGLMPIVKLGPGTARIETTGRIVGPEPWGTYVTILEGIQERLRLPMRAG